MFNKMAMTLLLLFLSVRYFFYEGFLTKLLAIVFFALALYYYKLYKEQKANDSILKLDGSKTPKSNNGEDNRGKHDTNPEDNDDHTKNIDIKKQDNSSNDK